MKSKITKITKKMSFAELMQEHPELAETLLEKGMSCIGCPMAQAESIEQGALSHGINPDKLVEELNEKLSKKKK